LPDVVKIRNETPTDIWVGFHQRRTFRPLEEADYTLPSNIPDFRWQVPGLGDSILRHIWKSSLPSVLTIDLALVTSTLGPGYSNNKQFLDKLPSLKQQGSNELRVTNGTSDVATVWLLDPEGHIPMGEIAPGETWEHPSEEFLIWYFRTRSGEPLGMLAHPFPRILPDPKPPFHVKLTTDFLEAWLAYQARKIGTGASTGDTKDNRGLGPLKLIGEKRSITPGPDDQIFITASTVRLDISEEPFNDLENREVRDVEIAGATLRWSKGNQILSGYYGENNAADIRSLTIFCDRMEVEDNLRFPRTNVTIYARELVFRGIGRIDTTPLPPAGRAKSEYLTQDPDDPTKTDVPADEDGHPTYKAADGRKGEPGGNITIYAREVWYEEPSGAYDPAIRFICRGGKGQQGEAGGLKAYVRGEEKLPEKYGPLPIVTADDVKRAFEDVFKLSCSNFRWPGDVDEPGKIADSPWQTNDVVSVSVFAFSAGLWCRRLYLPSRDWNSAGSWPSEDRNPSAWGCNGRGAYPGGWPGDGGDGGSFTLITEKPAPMIASLRDAGEMGDPTLPLWGDTVKQRPVHVFLKIWDKYIGQQTRAPEMVVSGRGGQHGREAFGRAGHPRSSVYRGELFIDPEGRGNYKYVYDNYFVSNEDRVFDTRPNKGKGGPRDQKERSDLSWAHPAAMAAVLSYARTAFRNGFREEAARALAPYYIVSMLQSNTVAKCSGEVRMAFSSMATLYNNFPLDLDYYGNPPGWVPRLNALSNLSVLKTVREAAYETYYFTDKMLREAQELEDVRDTAELAKAALKREMDTARQQVKRAYDELPRAMNKLNDVQKEVIGVGEEIAALRNEATIRAKDKAMQQRFFSAALQLVDGIAKSVPIGQPFLGAAGSVFGAASKIDWTAEKPLETASTALDDLSQQVTTFVTDKKEAAVAAVTSGLSGVAAKNEALVRQLAREQEDAGEKAAGEIDVTWQNVKSNELTRLEGQINNITAEIKKIRDAGKDDSDPEVATANGFVRALNEQKDRLTRMRVTSLQKQLVEYRQKQFELINRARRDAKIKTEALKKAAAQAPPSVAQRLKAATRQSEDLKAKLDDAKNTANNVMSQFESLGSGLASVGKAIMTMATPISDADPTVQRLASELLVDDPVLREKGQDFAKRLEALLAKKKQAATELMQRKQMLATSLDTVTRNLATLSQLSRQRQSIDMGLNPAAKAYLKETRDAAKDALAESIYWFAKSYHYEFLMDVQDSFFNFDTWTSELIKQENTKSQQANPNPDQPAGPGGVVTRAPKILLSKEDFLKIGDQVFQAEQLKLGKDLLGERQKRAPENVIKLTDCVLRRVNAPKTDWEKQQNEMLDALAQGETVFDFVRDFEKGSYDWNNARVSKVELVKLDIEATNPNLSLTFRVEQRGDMVIAQTVGTDRDFYRFRPGSYSDPVGWEFGYNHQKRRTDSGIEPGKQPDDVTLEKTVREMLHKDLQSATFKEYQPSLFSNYVIRITDLYAGGTKKGLKTINELNMTVFVSHSG
jgi:hypothetical protein